jgi:two-component system invasion response regulator UvrY
MRPRRMRLKILIVDDHAVIHDGLKKALTADSIEAYFGDALNVPEAQRLLSAERWDLMILDLDMPGRGGLDFLRQVKEEQHNLPVLIFSFHAEDELAIRALRAGASGYLSKSSGAEQICDAIRTVSRGGRYVSAQVVQRIAAMLGKPQPDALHERLSDREFQVMRLLASGKSSTDVAESLCISIKTVSTYRTRILEKLHLATTSEMIHYAIKHGLD